MPAVQTIKHPPVSKAHPQRRYVNQRKERLLRVVKVALIAILSIGMALLQTPITVTGFFIGIAFKPEAEKALERVTHLFKHKTAATIGALIAASIIAFPIVFLAAGFATGAYLGVHFPTE